MKNFKLKKNIMMNIKNNNSNYNLLKGSGAFSNEPLWYRLIVILIHALFGLGVLWLCREWILPVMGAAKLNGFSLPDFIKQFKGRSP